MSFSQGSGSSSIAGSTDVALNNPVTNQVLSYDGTLAKWQNATSTGGGSWSVVVQVTADGTTDVSGNIQTVLTGLASSNSRSYEVVVEPAYPHTTSSVIYLNGKVRITTDNTKVRFRAPVKLGTGIDPDGFGGLSIQGTQGGTTTVSSGAVRGGSRIVVASAAGISSGQLVRIYDADNTGGASAGYKSELAEVIDVSGNTLYLDHPLHHDFIGTVTLAYLNPVSNSGFEDIHATFQGQQTAGFLFPAKASLTRYCYYRNVHFKGTKTNSWSREALSIRDSYRARIDNCTATMSWDYAVGSTYSYGFSADGATQCYYTGCSAANLRHGFTADKGAAGIIYTGCTVENATASGFDLHGNWARDILYNSCTASSSPDTYSAADGQRFGFLAGNTTFVNGCQYITYSGCVARGFAPYTTAGAGSGDGAGFGVVDGCSSVNFRSCRVLDSQQGILILSEIGVPITNTGIYDCEFNNMTSSDPSSRPPIPIYAFAGVAPNDVNGLIIEGCKIVNSPAAASIRIYGTAGNTLSDIVFSNNTWNRSQGASGVYSLDCRYLDHLVIQNNVFNYTRRGVAMLNCSGALVINNIFSNLTEPTNVLLDSGGNTSMIFAKNVISPAPTALSTAVTSTLAYVDITASVGVATGSLPTLPVGSKGAYAWDTTTGKPAWWSGTAWVEANVA